MNFGDRRAARMVMIAGCALMMATLASAGQPSEGFIPQAAKTAYTVPDSPSKVITSSYGDSGYAAASEISYTYASDGSVIEKITRYYVGSSPQDSLRDVIAYNAQGKEDITASYVWQNGAWQEAGRITYTYRDGRLAEKLDGTFANPEWEQYKTEYTYNEAGKVSTDLQSYFANDTWTLNMRNTNTYDEAGNLVLGMMAVSDGAGGWEENMKLTSDYNARGKLDSYSFWVRITADDPWVMQSIDHYLYDAADNVTGERLSILNGATSALEYLSRTDYTYDIAGRQITSESFSRSSESASWAPYRKMEYIYDSPVAVEAVPMTFSLLQNTPNPFNPVTAIPFALSEPGRVTLEVFSVSGQKVATLVDGTLAAGMHRVVWDAKGQAAGMYFCRIVVGGMEKTGKMMLVK